jgi:hypothetical protein
VFITLIMCWNAEVSLRTFLMGTIGALICVYLDELPKPLLLTTWSFTVMQLLEYFTWTYINDKPKIYYLSIIGLLLIFLQMFLLSYTVMNKKYQRILVTAFMVYLILYGIFILPEIKFNMKKGTNAHLEWEWSEMPPIFLFFTLSLYCIPILVDKNYAGFTFTTITILISLYYYYKYKTWGTMWCYFSNIIWVIFVLFSLSKKFLGLEKVWFWNY